MQAFTNPFSVHTQINYSLTEYSDVKMKVIDMYGNTVFEDEFFNQSSGTHSLYWNGKTLSGSEAANGVYIIEISAGAGRCAAKVIKM